MAGWLRIVARSFAVAAVAGAAQLGTAQALGLLSWSSAPSPEVWRRQLMWLLFIFAGAVLAGVAGGRRGVRAVRLAIANRRAEAAARRNSGLVVHQPGLRAATDRALKLARYRTVDTARGIAAGASRVGATAFASLGAYLSFLLVWLPAREAYAATDVRVLATAALVGTAVGAVVSLLSLLAAPIAANAGVWLAGVWIFGLASAATALATDTPVATPRLAVFDAPHLIGPGDWWIGPYLMVVVAALIGGAVAATARWVGAHRLGIALSGLAGPVIVAAAYLMVGPHDELMSAYVCALLAATAGLLTSAAVAATQQAPAGPARSPQAITQAAQPATPAPPLAIAAPPGPVPATPVTPMTTTSPVVATASPYPAPKPASQYPAAAQYSANAFPTNQYPTLPGWSSATPSTSDVSRSVAPVVSAPVTPPAPRPSTPAPAPLTAPVTASAAPTTAPATAGPQSPAPVTTPPATTASATTASAAAASATTAPVAAAPVPASATVAEAAPAPTSTATSAATPPTATPAPAVVVSSSTGDQPAKATSPEPPAPAKGRKHKGRADRTVRVPDPVRPEPVRRKPSAEELPRTARPAEVVAVQSSRTSPAPMDLPKSRRARRRAEKLAAERAEQEAKLARQRAREAASISKREREHIAWVQRLTSMPADPSLTREK